MHHSFNGKSKGPKLRKHRISSLNGRFFCCFCFFYLGSVRFLNYPHNRQTSTGMTSSPTEMQLQQTFHSKRTHKKIIASPSSCAHAVRRQGNYLCRNSTQLIYFSLPVCFFSFKIACWPLKRSQVMSQIVLSVIPLLIDQLSVKLFWIDTRQLAEAFGPAPGLYM